jgi:WD40 repeat protein
VFIQAPQVLDPVPNCVPVPVPVFDFATGRLLHTISAQDGASIGAEAISSTGMYLLYSTYPSVENPLLHLWDIRGERELQPIKDEYPVGFTADEKLLITLNRHKTEVHVWRTSTGELIHNIAEPGAVNWVKSRGKSDDILLGVEEVPEYDFVLQSLNAATGVENFRQKFDPNKHPFNLSDDGTRITTEGAHRLEVWNTKTGSAFFSLPGSRYENCQFSREGKRIYCVGLASITVWDVDQQRKLAEKELNPSSLGGAVVFSPEDDLLGIGSTILRADTLESACGGHLAVFQFLGRGQFFESNADQRDCSSSEVLKKYRLY